MELPVVSVVIPIYNAARFLAQCLDTLLGQTYPEFEVVCVDDGSTDNSSDIVLTYAARDSRIRAVSKRNEGGGAASARNLGLSLAKGKYVQFLDSDDFFDKDMLEQLVRKAEAVEAQVVICNADRFDQRLGKVVAPYEHISLDRAPEREPFSYQDCPDRIFQLGNVLAWNRLYRRDFLLGHGLYFEPIPISDDLYLPALALVLAERIAVVDRPFVHYRFHTGTSQVDTLPKHPEAGYAANFSIVKKMREYGVYEEVKRSWLDVSLRMMRAYFDQMAEYRDMQLLYEVYRAEVLPLLGAEALAETDFYDPRLWSWYQMLCNQPLEEILFHAARGFGTGNTTAVLRFQVPYEKLERGSRIALVGKGLVGRYWYAQLLLSGYCEIVCWIDTLRELPPDLQYDIVLEAK